MSSASSSAHARPPRGAGSAVRRARSRWRERRALWTCSDDDDPPIHPDRPDARTRRAVLRPPRPRSSPMRCCGSGAASVVQRSRRIQLASLLVELRSNSTQFPLDELSRAPGESPQLGRLRARRDPRRQGDNTTAACLTTSRRAGMDWDDGAVVGVVSVQNPPGWQRGRRRHRWLRSASMTLRPTGF